jgi:hypothetical protein
MKIVYLEKLWNFVVDNFLIWIRLGPQKINLHLIWYNIWGTEIEYRHKWKRDVAVEELARVWEVTGSILVGREVSKNCFGWSLGSSCHMTGRWVPPLIKKIKKIPIFFRFFRFGRQSLCRVSDKRHSVKAALPTAFLPCALCRVWHSTKPLSSVFRALPSALDTNACFYLCHLNWWIIWFSPVL